LLTEIELNRLLEPYRKITKTFEWQRNWYERVKATNLMAKITHCQPFEDGNRRTGIVSATKFLQDNGYDIDIESGQANLDIRKMLKEIKLHSRTLHVETMNKMFFYISKRIKVYEPTG
jgi:prophage maintenance system killer protein